MLIRVFLQIMRSDSNLKNSDAEIQQRALEYLKLSTVASPDVLVSFIIEPLLVIIYKIVQQGTGWHH